MKNSAITALLLFASLVAFAQAPDIEWENTIGGSASDDLSDISLTNDLGYILGGSSGSNVFADKTDPVIGWLDYWILKLDSIGNILWQQTIGGTDFDYLTSISQTEDGGFIVGGYSNSGISGNKTEANNGDYDIWVLKLDSTGNILWQNTIGGDLSDKLFAKILQTSNGEFILGATSKSNTSADKSEDSLGEEDYWLIKLDSTGSIVWENTIGGNSSDVLYSIIETQDGGFLLGGTSISDVSGDKTEPVILRPDGLKSIDYWILKIDSAGNIISQKVLGGNYHDSPYNVQLGEYASYFLGGSSNSPASFDKSEDSYGDSDYWVVYSDSNLNIIWQKTIGGNLSDELRSGQFTFQKGYIVAGYSPSDISGNKTTENLGYDDYWLVKLDSVGTIAWQLELGGSDFDRAVKVLQTPDGGYFVGGWSSSNISTTKSEDAIGGEDYWVIKLAPDEDCVPSIYYFDNDSDGFGDLLSDTISCELPPGYVANGTDCNDNDNNINPSKEELCDSIDNNCNGLIDEGFIPMILYADWDSDVYGSMIDSITTCNEVEGYILISGDCDDFNSSIFPGAEEILNGFDDNCNGSVDEGLVGVNDLLAAAAQIYPNPNNGIFEIHLKNVNPENIYIVIYDLFGNIIYNKQYNYSDILSIYLPGSHSGVFNVVIQTGETLICNSVNIIKN